MAGMIGRRPVLAGLGALAVSALARASDGAVRSGGAMTTRVNTRLIPKTREPLPVIGMGTWQTFDVGGDASERQPLREVLRRFYAAGARVIDSSPMYGRSEEVVGELLAELGERPRTFLATKVWTTGQAQGVREMNESMRRMRAGEAIDLMQVHNLVDVETHLATLREWKAAGKVRYVGVTHYALSAFAALERWIRSGQLDFVQLPYSVAVREAEKRLLPAAKDQGVAVLVMRPFEGGTLFSRARKLPLPPFAAELGATSWAQLFLKFIVAHPAVTCAIPATSKPEHVADNLRALQGALPDEAQRAALLRQLGI